MICLHGPAEGVTGGRRVVKDKWMTRAGPLLVAIILLLVIAGISIFTLSWSWPAEDIDHRLEVTKASLQVLGVAILGGLAAISFAGIRQRWADEQKGREERAERWRREGEALKALAEDTIQAYNRVKSIRRALRNDINTHNASRDNDFQQHLAELNDVQLEFERLRRIVPFSALDQRATEVGIRAGNEIQNKQVPKTVAGLCDEYGHIVRFLGNVLEVWESARDCPKQIPDPSFSGDGSGHLGDLLHRESFRGHVTDNVNLALVVLLQVRLMPPSDSA